MTYIKLTGNLEILWESQTLEPRHNKPLLLLIYLAYYKDWISRDKLAFLFWPDSDESKSKQNLRSIIYRAKNYGFAGLLEIEADRLRWKVATDIERIKESIANQEWKKLIENYRGNFLENIALKNESGFEVWLLQERSDLERAWCNATNKYIIMLEQANNFSEANILLEKLLKTEPLAEDILQRYLRNCYLLKQKNSAIAAYKDFEELLKDELDLEPLEETTFIIKTIQSSGTLKTISKPKSSIEILVPMTVLRSPKLVGRGSAIKEIQKAEAKTIFIHGEAGIGKSRLISELFPQGLAIKCQEGLENIPFYPIISLIRQILAQGIIAPDLKHYNDDLARLVPEFAPQINPGPSDPESGKARLFEALSLYFEHLINSNNISNQTLFIDDLQWADSSSLDFLAYLANRDSIKLLGAYRTNEKTKALSKLISALKSRRVIRLIRLEPLPLKELNELLASLMNNKFGAPVFSHWLLKNTGGNPMFVLEALKSLFETGVLESNNESWQTDIDDITKDYSEITIPKAIQNVIQRRIEKLAPETQRVLQVAAVINQGFSEQLISQISGLSEWHVLDSLEEAQKTAFIQKDNFQHDLLRQNIYNDISSSRKKLLHLKTAKALKNSAEDSIVAEHYFMAGNNDKTAQLWIKAAKDYTEQGFLEYAEEYYKRVINLKPSLLLEQEAKVWLIDIYDLQAKPGLAAKLIKSLLLEVEDPTLRAHTLLSHVEQLLYQGQTTNARKTIAETKPLIEKSNDSYLKFCALNLNFKILLAEGSFQEALVLAKEALNSFPKNSKSHEYMHLFSSIGVMYDYLNKPKQALPYHQKAANMAKETSNINGYMKISSNLLRCYTDLGQAKIHIADVEELLKLDEADYQGAAWLRESLALAYVSIGQHKNAYDLFNYVYKNSEDKISVALSCVRSVELLELLGRASESKDMLGQAIKLLDKIDHVKYAGETFIAVLKYGNIEQKSVVIKQIQSFNISSLPGKMQLELKNILSSN